MHDPLNLLIYTCLLVVLSILAHVGILIWSADTGKVAREKANPSNLEASMTARRSTPPPTPAPTAAVRY